MFVLKNPRQRLMTVAESIADQRAANQSNTNAAVTPAGTQGANTPATPPATPPRSASTATPANGRQPDVALDDERIAKIVGAAVSRSLDAFGIRGPAVHTAHDDAEYFVDEAAESLGEERAEVMRENRRRSAIEDARGFGPSSVIREGEVKPAGKVGLAVAEYIGWMAAAAGDPERAYRLAKRHGGSKMIVRALGESTFSAGGAFIPENIATDYIELLYNAAVFLAAGPMQITVNNGNLTLPKLTGGATPTWIGESDNAAASQQQTGQVRVDLKKLAVLTAAANEFIRDSGPSAVQMIRDDLARAAAVAIDSAALRSLGSAYTPRGLRGWVPAANQYASGGTTVPLITTDLAKANRLIEEGKIISSRLAWFLAPRTKWGLMAARDGNNNEVWAPEMRQGTLYGTRFFSTQNIPTNVGTGGTKSEIYLAAMEHLIFAQEPAGVRVDVNDGAAYNDGSAVQSAFSRDETAVRLVQRCDVVDRQGGLGIVQVFDVAIA